MEEAKQLKEELRARGVVGIALDIDDTLGDSNLSWFSNLLSFKNIEGETAESLIKKHAHVEEVADWNTPEAFEFMGELIHSSEFNEAIPLIGNANHVVNEINKKVPIVAYITARPAMVAEATKRWLRRHGLPEAPLIMRPPTIEVSKDDLEKRNQWKSKLLNYLYPEVRGIVDDNLGLVDELADLNYQGTHYLYGKALDKQAPHLVVCPTWEDVAKSVKP